MSKHLFSFLIGEMEYIRVICKACKSTIEVRIDKINTRIDLRCSTCPAVFRDTRAQMDSFTNFATAVRALQADQLADIEFVLEEKGEKHV